jgi:hypothetical protein
VTKFRFKPEDFHGGMKYESVSPHYSAFRANELLDKAIAKCPVIYGTPAIAAWGRLDSTDTHKAVLFNIEEIEKKPCEHEPSYTLSGITQAGNSSILTNVAAKIVCSKCGITLKARWEAAE